jgi:hypothetical protein
LTAKDQACMDCGCDWKIDASPHWVMQILDPYSLMQ